MKKRIIAIIALFALALVALSACAEQNYDFADKIYVYEKLVNDSAFTLEINKDGTFTYRESANSSYIPDGTWTYEDGILTLNDNLSEELNFVNHFRVEGSNLVFVAEGSTNFPSVTVEDGDLFFNSAAN